MPVDDDHGLPHQYFQSALYTWHRARLPVHEHHPDDGRTADIHVAHHHGNDVGHHYDGGPDHVNDGSADHYDDEPAAYDDYYHRPSDNAADHASEHDDDHLGDHDYFGQYYDKHHFGDHDDVSEHHYLYDVRLHHDGVVVRRGAERGRPADPTWRGSREAGRRTDGAIGVVGPWQTIDLWVAFAVMAGAVCAGSLAWGLSRRPKARLGACGATEVTS